MPDNDKLIANPVLVLREEFDDWAILFDPDSGDAHALNPAWCGRLLIRRRLDGAHVARHAAIGGQSSVSLCRAMLASPLRNLANAAAPPIASLTT